MTPVEIIMLILSCMLYLQMVKAIANLTIYGFRRVTKYDTVIMVGLLIPLIILFILYKFYL